MPADTAVHPFTAVTVTEYVPVFLAYIPCVVAPVFHKYELADDEINNSESLKQNVVEPEGVIVAVGELLTTTEMVLLIAVHPAELETIQ